MVFPFFLAVFLAFWTAYLLFFASVLYHIREYTLPGLTLPKILIRVFVVLSLLLFLFSGSFLLALYKTL